VCTLCYTTDIHTVIAKLEGSKQLTPKPTVWHIIESVEPPPSLTTYFPNIRLTNYRILLAEHKDSTPRTPKPATGYDPTHRPFPAPLFLVTVVMLSWCFLHFLPNGYFPRNSSLKTCKWLLSLPLQAQHQQCKRNWLLLQSLSVAR